MDWVGAVYSLTAGQVLAIDGKTIRRSADKTNGKAALHVVSARANANQTVLGQVAVADKSNEITAIPELLTLLVVQGCMVTVDALGCQQTIAQAIGDAKAEYVLQVKAKQGHLYQDVEEWFAYAQQTRFAAMSHSHERVVGKVHERRESRDCWVVSDPVAFEYSRHYDCWPDLNSIATVVRRRWLNNSLTIETAYYISSLDNDAALRLACARSHWAVENLLQWVLDVAFRQNDAGYQQGGTARKISPWCANWLSICYARTQPPKLELKAIA